MPAIGAHLVRHPSGTGRTRAGPDPQIALGTSTYSRPVVALILSVACVSEAFEPVCDQRGHYPAGKTGRRTQAMSQQERTILIVRHAKAAWPEDVADEKRPLAPRGEVDAPAVGKWLAKQKLIPQSALVSPARRTRQTWDLISKQLPGKIDVRLEDDIYAAHWTELLDVLRLAPKNADVIALVGHNPGCQTLVRKLAAGGSNKKALARVERKFPTSGVAVLRFSGPWTRMTRGSAVLMDFEVPRG